MNQRDAEIILSILLNHTRIIDCPLYMSINAFGLYYDIGVAIRISTINFFSLFMDSEFINYRIL